MSDPMKTKKPAVEARLDRLERVATLVLKHIRDAGERNVKYAEMRNARDLDAEAERLWCMTSQANGIDAEELLGELGVGR